MLALVLLVQVLLCGSVFCDGSDPTFTWLEDQDVGVPQMKITFPDGSSDVIYFFENQEFNDEGGRSCIMNGKCKNEEEVNVVLTGSCMNGSDFEMTIVGSKKLQRSIFKVANGTVVPTVLSSDQNERFLNDIQNRESSSRFSPLDYPFNGLQLEMEWYYDDDFSKGVTPSNANYPQGRNFLLQVIAHTQAWFLKGSFRVDLRLQINSASHYPDSLGSSQCSLDKVQNVPILNYKTQARMFIGLRDAIFDYANANRGTICNDRQKAVGIALHGITIAGTGIAAATSIAYMLGIEDDSGRSAADGISCSENRNIMYSSLFPTQWSPCSAEDFNSRYSNGILSCLTEYECHDQPACESNTKEQCTDESKKLILRSSCPNLCGVCKSSV